MSSSGLSRRALFGLGLSRIGERLDAAGPAAAPARPDPPERPTLEQLRERWSRARTPEGDALWAPVAARLRELAGDEDAVISVFGVQCDPDGRGALRELFTRAGPGGAVAFAVWAPGAVAQLLKAAADLDPMPPGLPGAWGWGSHERLRQDLDHVADEIAYHRGDLLVPGATGPEAVERLAAGVPALAATLERHGEAALGRLAGVAAPWLQGDGDGVALPVPHLLVHARAR